MMPPATLPHNQAFFSHTLWQKVTMLEQSRCVAAGSVHFISPAFILMLRGGREHVTGNMRKT